VKVIRGGIEWTVRVIHGRREPTAKVITLKGRVHCKGDKSKKKVDGNRYTIAECLRRDILDHAIVNP
jgi:hypothetical protein